MTDADLSGRIADQFSYRGPSSEVWRAFDLVLATDRYLNLGYSRRFQTHLLGAPQERLVGRVASELLETAGVTPGSRLLDLGCGRGGPSLALATGADLDVVGVDLVPYNLAVARSHAAGRERSPAYVTGDATRLPFVDGTFPAIAAIDAVVYMPDKRAVFEEVARVLEPGGVCIVSDLLAAEATDPEGTTLQTFTNAWDMPPLATSGTYRAALESAGLRLVTETDLSAHSIAGFRKWTALYLAIAESAGRTPLFELFERYGIDPDAMTEQVRAAHDALPSLRHVLLRIESDRDASGTR